MKIQIATIKCTALEKMSISKIICTCAVHIVYGTVFMEHQGRRKAHPSFGNIDLSF